MKRKGFSLMELTIVITLMVALAGVMTPMFYSSKESANIARANAEMDAIAAAIRSYFSDNGNFVRVTGAANTTINGEAYVPATGVHGTAITAWSPADDSIKTTVSECMDYLVKQGYLSKVTKDPWGNHYQVVLFFTQDLNTGRPKSGEPSLISIRSAGKNGTPDDADDITINVLEGN